MHDSVTRVGNVAGALADDGHTRRATLPSARFYTPPQRLSCRDASMPRAREQDIIDRIGQLGESAGFAFPRWLIVNYSVSLKTNPLVILAGAEGTGKAVFVQLFARALLGADSSQFAVIPSRAAWCAGTGEGSYYRSMQDRFTSLRFLELLQEAGAPANAGKLYLICFQRLLPSEIESYLTSMLHISHTDEWRLNIPSLPGSQQPIIPPNVRITATVDTIENPVALSRAALNHASVIDFTTPIQHRFQALDHSAPPPVGLQRRWLRSSLHTVSAARLRLNELLGPEQVGQLGPSSQIQEAIWESGLPLYGHMLQGLTVAVANAFDEQGNGLFDPSDRLRNAQNAYDTQLIQRVRWRVEPGACPSIADYFGEDMPRRQVA
jgi:hypothetical protein